MRKRCRLIRKVSVLVFNKQDGAPPEAVKPEVTGTKFNIGRPVCSDSGSRPRVNPELQTLAILCMRVSVASDDYLRIAYVSLKTDISPSHSQERRDLAVNGKYLGCAL
jgi:hypothetical protein